MFCSSDAILRRLDFKLDGEDWRVAFGKPGGVVAGLRLLSPWRFFGLRIVIFVVWLVAVVWSTVDAIADGVYGCWWTKLENICAITELGYFGLAGYSTYRAVKAMSAYEDLTTPWFISVTWLFATTIPAMSCLVLFLHWGLVYEAGPGEPKALDVVMNGGSAVLLLLDLFISRQPCYILHVYAPVVFAAVYTLFTYVYYVAGGTDEHGNLYIYEAIDWSRANSTGALVGQGFLILLGIYGVLYLLTIARRFSRTAAWCIRLYMGMRLCCRRSERVIDESAATQVKNQV